MPDPSVVWLFESETLEFELIAMPLAVTAAPPSEVTLPPLTTLLEVMLEAESVETVGRVGATHMLPFQVLLRQPVVGES